MENTPVVSNESATPEAVAEETLQQESATCALNAPAGSIDSAPQDDAPSSASSTSDENEADEDIIVAIMVDEIRTRVRIGEFVDNVGRKALLNSIHAIEAPEERITFLKKIQPRCDCQFPHDILDCTMLHLLDEVIKIGKVDAVRLKTLLRNKGFENLLRKPKSRHMVCASEKEHDPLTCKSLHKDSRALPVGRERLGFFPDEMLDNAGSRQLKANPEYTGRWCTNKAKHEARDCLFLHRAPKLGETIGKRNRNISSGGKLTVETGPLWEKKKKQRNAVVNSQVAVPEFAKQHRADLLDQLVAKINAADDDDVEAEEVKTAAECSETGTGGVSATHQEKKEEHSNTNAHGKKHHDRTTGLWSLHPALIAMLAALLVAFVVSFLPE